MFGMCVVLFAILIFAGLVACFTLPSFKGWTCKLAHLEIKTRIRHRARTAAACLGSCWFSAYYRAEYNIVHLTMEIEFGTAPVEQGCP